jgi:ADP-heptose:LPS heptosyltransferase
MGMGMLIKPTVTKRKEFSIREFHEKRNKVLILRTVGGAGDILMHRMMFEDFKLIMPECSICFACPTKYHALVKDHPFIDELLDWTKVDYHDYIVSYNTSKACGRYEITKAPFADLHRSDIWAEHCGVKLTRHNMHVTVDPEALKFGREKLKQMGRPPGQPAVLLCPVSAMLVKNMTDEQMIGLVGGLRAMGCFVYATHYMPIPILTKLNVPQLYGVKLSEWMGVVATCDYCVSVDTASFHFAGGIGKPVVGMFTFADGKVYGKYYDFELVQKHRDNGDWPCGPCYNWTLCPKTNKTLKPCLTEITSDMLMDGVQRMFRKHPWNSRREYSSM